MAGAHLHHPRPRHRCLGHRAAVPAACHPPAHPGGWPRLPGPAAGADFATRAWSGGSASCGSPACGGCWSLGAARTRVGKHSTGPAPDRITYVLAFWAGISWLVRPELALYGGPAGCSCSSRDVGGQRALILAVALPVPAGYQIFRMGYYGLLTAHGRRQVGGRRGVGLGLELRAGPGGPVPPVAGAALVALGAVTLWRVSASAPNGSPAGAPAHPVAVTTLILVAGTIHVLYVLRVGGDLRTAACCCCRCSPCCCPWRWCPCRPAQHLDAVGRDHGGGPDGGVLVVREHDAHRAPHRLGDRLRRAGIVDERDF